MKHTKIWKIWVPKKEERERGREFSRNNTWKFPNLEKEIDIWVQETQSPKQDQPNENHTKIHCN